MLAVVSPSPNLWKTIALGTDQGVWFLVPSNPDCMLHGNLSLFELNRILDFQKILPEPKVTHCDVIQPYDLFFLLSDKVNFILLICHPEVIRSSRITDKGSFLFHLQKLLAHKLSSLFSSASPSAQSPSSPTRSAFLPSSSPTSEKIQPLVQKISNRLVELFRVGKYGSHHLLVYISHAKDIKVGKVTETRLLVVITFNSGAAILVLFALPGY